MSRRSLSWLSVALLAGVVGLHCARLDVHTGQAQAAAAANTGWEYQTASIDLGSLTPKLIELSRDGWEVINIISVDTMIDQTPDGKTHILTQRVEVTSRKPK